MKGLSGSVGRRQVCDSGYCTGNVTIFNFIRRGRFLSNGRLGVSPKLPQCASCLRFHVPSVPYCVVRPLGCGIFFSPSNAFMASARSLHTFNRGKQLNCNFMQGCQLVESHKSAGSGPVRSPEAVPARKQTRKQTKNNKAKTGKKHTTTTKPKQKRHREVGSPPAMGIHA